MACNSSGFTPGRHDGGGDSGRQSGSPDATPANDSASDDAANEGGRQPGADGSANETGDSGGSDATDGGVAPPGYQIYVATTGSDTNPGTKDQPLKTVGAAQTMVRAHPDRGMVPITVNVLMGTYYVGKTIVFTSADSGTQAAPVTYRGGGTATLSGGVPLNLTWSPYKNGIMQAAVPASTFANLSFDNGQAAPGLMGTYGFSSVLLLNGQRQHMARYPNYTNPASTYGGNAGDAQSRPGSWAHPPTSSQPAYLHGVQAEAWGSEDYVVTSSSQQKGPLCNGRPQGLNGTQMIENAFDELDAPGEWYYDRGGLAGTAGTLYFYPPAGADLTMAGAYTLEMAGIERIFELDGGCSGGARTLEDGGVGLPSYSMTSTCASTAPVQWLTLDGFHYIDTLRTFPSCNETLLRSDWNIYRGGTIFVEGGENVTISNSFFDQIGGGGVFVNGYNDSVAVTGNRFIDTGSSAIMFMGTHNAVRNALIGYGTLSVPVNQLDTTPGPQTNDYPSNCSATDNLIHDIGDPQLQVAGVAIDMAENITVSHNSIYNMPRAGINVGDGCWGGHVISYNDVFNTVLFTGDHGSYNSWGRDRYWDYSTGAIESRVAQAPQNVDLPLLDAIKPITLANNRWRCDHGWDVDMDDGSTNYVITNNVFLSGGLKWREGYGRNGNNNVFNTVDTNPSYPPEFYPQLWPTDNGDVFTHNILMGYSPTSPDGWGKELDYNFFLTASGLSSAQGDRAGVDVHSASGNPGFMDPNACNFMIPSSSPALAVGITSLPPDVYGVTDLGLRAQAQTPPCSPNPQPVVDAGYRDPTPETWRGATVENLIGAGEESATGLSSEVGVYVAAISAGSQAATDGLQVVDVILEFNGQNVVSLTDLNTYYAATTMGQMINLGIHRADEDILLTITR